MNREFAIEVPAVGKISSDSGNHFVDIISVVGVIFVLILIKKKVWDRL